MLKKLSIVVISIFIISVLFTACSAFSAGSEAEESMDKSYVMEEAAMPEAPMDAEASAGESDFSNVPEMERKVIKTSNLDLEIESGTFDDNILKISNLAEKNGGFVSNSESYSDAEGNLSSGRITIRVPAEKFDFILDEIKNIGKVQSINISGQDVTEEYVDLESRLRNLEKQEEVLLDLMAQSKDVEDSIQVQRELSNVQGDIEVIKGRMNYIDNMVSFSTIEVYLSEPSAIKTSSGWGFLDALKRGARGAINVLNGLITALIIISPVLVFVAIIVIIVWAIIRARKRRRANKE